MMVLGMAVRMRGVVIVLAIGAALGIERLLDAADAGAQPLQHVDDDVIVADQDDVVGDFRRQVAVAEMPGEPRQPRGAVGPHLDQRLGQRHDLDDRAIGQRQPVALSEAARRRPPDFPVRWADRRNRDVSWRQAGDSQRDRLRGLWCIARRSVDVRCVGSPIRGHPYRLSLRISDPRHCLQHPHWRSFAPTGLVQRQRIAGHDHHHGLRPCTRTRSERRA